MIKKYWKIYFFIGVYHCVTCFTIEEVNRWIEVFEKDKDNLIPYIVEEIFGGRGRKSSSGGR